MLLILNNDNPFLPEVKIPAVLFHRKEKIVKKYELTVVLRPDSAESLVQKVKDTLQKYEVKVASDDPWGLKQLAYEIDGELSGYYYYADIESPPESIEKIVADFRLTQDILRYMFVASSNKESLEVTNVK